MTLKMDCARAQELFSDRHEGVLAEPLASDVQAHLAGCADCRELMAALGEVVEALHHAPALEPPAGLAERIADVALRAPRPPVRVVPRPAPMPVWLQAVAAVMALAVTGLVLLAATPGAGGDRAAQLKQSSVKAGVYLEEHRERLIEDLRLLRVVVATAFEGRVDRVSDRVDDYRRLLEKRKASEQDGKKTNFIIPNSGEAAYVTLFERRVARASAGT